MKIVLEDEFAGSFVWATPPRFDAKIAEVVALAKADGVTGKDLVEIEKYPIDSSQHFIQGFLLALVQVHISGPKGVLIEQVVRVHMEKMMSTILTIQETDFSKPPPS